MTKKEFEDIRKNLLLKMKFMDTTIKNIKESEEYKEVNIYNKGIRDCIKELEKHVNE